MRVRMVKTLATPEGIASLGDVVNVPTSKARELVEAGIATYANPDDAPEAATAAERETATLDAPDEGARPRRRG